MRNSLLKKLSFLFLLLVMMSIAMVGCVKTEPASTFVLSYNVETGGCISGETTQTLEKNKDGTFVTAMPNEGYLFAGWSDGMMGATRQEKNNGGILNTTMPYPVYNENMAEKIWGENIGLNLEITAKFVKKTKTLNYNYDNATSSDSEKSITLTYDKIGNASFVIPTKENYVFGGWYLDPEFTIKVTNENGIYYLGHSIFFSESDTIYAKWTNTESTTFKILLVFVDEIHAELNFANGTIFPVNYKMPLSERKICELIPKQLSKYLNDWFDGTVVFEIDAYFTTMPVGRESFLSGRMGDDIDYSCFANDIPEMGPILKDYRNVTVTVSINDYKSLLHLSTGTAIMKYAAVNLDSKLISLLINKMPLESYLDTSSIIWEEFIRTYIHEFTHTVESSLDVYEYHGVEKHYWNQISSLEVSKLYLLNQAEINGVKVGIPSGFWKGEFEVRVSYAPNVIDGNSPGKVVIVGSEEPEFPWIDYVGIKVPFGSDLTVEAIPKEGFRFSHWSDGITTAIRHDKNIISYLTVKAIFVKI